MSGSRGGSGDGPRAAARPESRGGLRRLLRWAVLVVLLAYGAACWVASGSLLTPERRLPRAGGADAAFADGAAAHGLQDVELLTDDGLRLAAWVLEPEGDAHGTVLMFHGKDGCRQASRLRFVAERGFRALAVDSRAHGASEGEWTTFGWDERRDVAAAWEYARARWGDDEPLIAWGTSQGAAAVVYFADAVRGESEAETEAGTGVDAGADADAGAAGAPPSDRRVFDGLILESLYVDVDTAFRNRVRRWVGGWAMPLAWPVRGLVSWRAEIDPGGMAPGRILQRLCVPGAEIGLPGLAGVPILIATGTEDAYATPAEAERLLAATADGQGQLVLVPGRRHQDLLGGSDSVYSTAIDAFLAAFRQ